MRQIWGITLHEPWASAIALGPKRIENRSWKPQGSQIGHYLAIHAGKTWDREGAEWIEETFGLTILQETTTPGTIIAVARLAEVVQESSDPWFFGPYGWVLDAVCAIPPVPCRGALGLWPLPPDVLEDVRVHYMQLYGRVEA